MLRGPRSARPGMVSDKPMDSLKHRVIVVTGAAGGLGSAVARRLGSHGAKLLLVDSGTDVDGRGRDPSRLEALGRELPEALLDTTDVRDKGAIAHLLSRAESALGPIDGVVHAAGFQREATVVKCSEDDLMDLLDGHVRTSFAVVRGAAERMTRDGRPGSIVLFTSPSAFFGVARQAASAASAAAIAALVRTSALELRKHGVRINAVAPTARTRLNEDTPMFKSIRADSMTAEQVAPLVCYLLAEEANAVSGEWIGSAGGRHYALMAREATGAFLGPIHDEAAIAASFGEIVRP